jgi:hypothetical protein
MEPLKITTLREMINCKRAEINLLEIQIKYLQDEINQYYKSVKNKDTICKTCNDTHWMMLGDDRVMCTRCPVPCQQCRRFGNGPYCEVTPCSCRCHVELAEQRGRFDR